MITIKPFNDFLFEKSDNFQKLAGVLIIIDDKALLVKPQKYKDQKQMWSVPKGKIDEGESVIDTALRELEEETGIILTEDIIKDGKKLNIFYDKNDKKRKLTVFVVYLNREDLNIDITKKLKSRFNNKEVYEIKFFTMRQDIKRIEKWQRPLLSF